MDWPRNLTCPGCKEQAPRHCTSPTCNWYSSQCGLTVKALKPDPKAEANDRIWLCRVMRVRTTPLPPLQQQ